MCDEEEEEKEGRLSRQKFQTLRKQWAADEERIQSRDFLLEALHMVGNG